MVESIQKGIDNGKAYDMTSLLSMYQSVLQKKGVNAESYTKQRLKQRLQNHFSSRIVFHQPFDKRKSEVVYSSQISVQNVINVAVDLHPSRQQSKEDGESLGDEEHTDQIFKAVT